MQKIIRFFDSVPVVVNRITLQSDRAPGSSIIPACFAGSKDQPAYSEAEREREYYSAPLRVLVPSGLFPTGVVSAVPSVVPLRSFPCPLRRVLSVCFVRGFVRSWCFGLASVGASPL